jgi:hypothetical protein
MKAQNPAGEEWDYLVVLDACRYDFFERVYREYLDGSLEKRRSPGSSTPEWVAEAFPDSYDIGYVSANPFVNGIDVALDETKWGSSCGYSWRATDHFEAVYDVWNTGWDEELGTVPPEAVNRVVAEKRDAIADHDRTVIHYLQPHAPYISGGTGRKLKHLREGVDAGGEAADGGFLNPVRRRVEAKLGQSELAMKLGMLVELSPLTLLDAGQEGSRAVIERHYEENLRLVMESVAELVADLDGRVVVTADHGEAFGEQGVWEHHVGKHIPVLVEVPWLELD